MEEKRLLVFKLIDIQYNYVNAICFDFIHLDLTNPNIESSLLGFNASLDFLYIDLLFFKFKIFDKTD
jgi:hypothetical protein